MTSRLLYLMWRNNKVKIDSYSIECWHWLRCESDDTPEKGAYSMKNHIRNLLLVLAGILSAALLNGEAQMAIAMSA